MTIDDDTYWAHMSLDRELTATTHPGGHSPAPPPCPFNGRGPPRPGHLDPVASPGRAGTVTAMAAAVLLPGTHRFNTGALVLPGHR